MELEPVYIRIRKVDNVRHAYLGLEGTILLFDQRQAAIDSELLIPVELVTIAEGLRFEGRRLIAAVLCLLRAAVAGRSLHRTALPVPARSRRRRTRPPSGSSALVLWECSWQDSSRFSSCLVRFFFRVKTVRLDIRRKASVANSRPA